MSFISGVKKEIYIGLHVRYIAESKISKGLNFIIKSSIYTEEEIDESFLDEILIAKNSDYKRFSLKRQLLLQEKDNMEVKRKKNKICS